MIHHKGKFGIALLLASISIAQAQDLKPEELYKKTLPSVMTLFVEQKDGSKWQGTGFLALKDGLAVTAWHVVKDAKSVMAKFSDGEVFESSGLIDKDELRDVAIIKVKVFGRPKLDLKADDPAVGSKAFTIGAPKGLEFSIADGLVSQIQTIKGVKYYQNSIPTSHGNSGGPVLNANGSVIGVVSWGRTDGQDLNFAIPAPYVLGLDSTLPTTEWSAVTGAPSSSTETPNTASMTKVADADFDKMAFDSWEVAYNMNVAFQMTVESVVRVNNGFRSGVPTDLYRRQRASVAMQEKLKSVKSENSVRENLRVSMLDDLTNLNSATLLLIESVKAAQIGNGWQGNASDTLKRGYALLQDFIANQKKDNLKPFLALGLDTTDRCPNRIKEQIGITPDSAGYLIGIGNFTDIDQRFIVFVVKGQLAEKFGLKSGDMLKELDGKAVESILQFKKDLKAFLGKKVKVVVIREGKDLTIELKVPAELAKP
jgi:S1-C subfamily serine protease